MHKKTFPYLRNIIVTLMTVAVLIGMAMVSPASAAQVFINFEPDDIRIKYNEPIDIPLFLLGDELTNNEVECYIWIDGYNKKLFLYLSEEGTLQFKGFTDNSQLKPVIPKFKMPQYIGGIVTLLNDTASLKDDITFDFNLCLDPIINGSFDSDAATCGMGRVLVIHDCSQVNIPDPISLSVESGKNLNDQTIIIKNICGEPLPFTAAVTKGYEWMSVTNSTVSFNTSNLPVDKYTGEIDVTVNSTSVKIPVTIEVKTSSQWKLTINKTGSGTGNVTASPGVLTPNGNSWEGTYSNNTDVILTATADTGSTFSSWSGCEIATGTTCKVKMTSDKAVTVTFSPTNSVNVCQILPFLCPGGGGGGCTPTQVRLSPAIINETLKTTGTAVTPKTIDVTVTDNCGKSIPFDITPTNGTWVTTSKTTGILTLTLKGAGNTTLTISSGTLTTAKLYITATLDQCTPQAQPIVNPNSVTGSTTPGNNYSFTLRVTDGCNNLAFTATPDPIDRITIKDNTDNSKEITYKIYSTDTNPQYTGKVTVSIPSKGFQTTVNITISVSTVIPGGDVTTLSGPYGQYRDFIVKANNYKMFKLFATASLKNRPLQIGMTDTAPWEGGWNLDMVVKWAGTNCELGEPTMNDYNKIRPFAEADPINHGCLNGLNEGCIVPSLSQGSNIGYYYYKFSLYGPDEFLDIAGGNSAYPDYPDQPHGCYYIMIVNNTTHNKTVSMTWADNDAP